MSLEDDKKVTQVCRKMDGKKDTVYVGMKVIIDKSAPYFQGEEAGIAYIGEDGVSVYLLKSDFDECIPLNWGEFYAAD